MKKQILFFVSLVITFSSCVTITPKAKQVPYTSVEKIVSLKPGMSYAEVSSTLGIPPYDVHYLTDSEGMALQYFYRLKVRKFKLPSMNNAEDFYESEEFQTIGEPKYLTSEPQILLVMFKEGKMSSALTGAGLQESEAYLLKNDNIKIINKGNFQRIVVGEKVGQNNQEYLPKDTLIAYNKKFVKRKSRRQK
ncbi:MAG: hypothetical protein SFU27_00655 [Thermonemataceae bacterium]|nr:hypothetical protein [Thermonemataceae bacterium]